MKEKKPAKTGLIFSRSSASISSASVVRHIFHFHPRLRRDVSYRPYIFTNEELFRFLECTKNMPGSMQRKTVFYMLFSLLICTGLRLGEALRLKWLDIDWNSKPMMVSVIGAKFDKDREIPLSDGIAKQLSEYREEMSVLFPACEYLFPSRNYAPYSENQVYITFRRILWSAGISPWRNRKRSSDS